MTKPKPALVYGIGREGSNLFRGDDVPAELVKPLGNGGLWWVRFPGDFENGKPVLRVRFLS